MIFRIEEKSIILTRTIYCLAFATNIPVLLMDWFMVLGHKWQPMMSITLLKEITKQSKKVLWCNVEWELHLTFWTVCLSFCFSCTNTKEHENATNNRTQFVSIEAVYPYAALQSCMQIFPTNWNELLIESPRFTRMHTCTTNSEIKAVF